jgi:O-antigen ligase
VLVGLGACAVGTALAWHHPVAPFAATLAFLLWCVCVAHRPERWLFVVPALLPLMNFGPWTGWIVHDEFDLLMWGVCAGGYAHWIWTRQDTRPEMPVSSSLRIAVGLAVLFAALGAVAFVRGWRAADPAAIGGWFQGYTDPLNSWRSFKPVLYAGLVWPLLRIEIRQRPDAAVQRIASGMLVGLTVVTLAVIWERLAYVGVWDFSSRYRTVALFWEMHVGGAAIDVYLALATPFVAWALWTPRSPLRWMVAAVLALFTGYVCLTTFSRGVYGAVAGSLLLLALLLRGWCLPRVRWRVVANVALALALALEVAVVLGLGSFMRERMAASDQDLDGRLTHWRNGLGLIRSPVDAALGIGLGRLPAAYANAVRERPFPGGIQWAPPGPGQSSGSIVVAGPRAPLDTFGLMTLTQRVALHPAPAHELIFDVRAAVQTTIYLQLCEMHLLYPRHCQSAWVSIPPSGAAWRHVLVRLRGPVLDAGPAWAPRRGVFSIAVTNDGGVAELDNLSLVAPDGNEMLTHRDFSDGMAGWYPAAQGYYVPWHIDNLYLELLIERGAFALLAFVSCLGWTLWRLVAAARSGSAIAPFLIASLCGGLCVGLVSSVMDVPRVAFLMLFLVIVAVEVAPGRLHAGTCLTGDE